MIVTSTNSPFVFGESFRQPQPYVMGIKLNGGTVVTEQRVGGVWVNTGDAYGADGSYVLTTGPGGVAFRVVVTGAAVVEI